MKNYYSIPPVEVGIKLQKAKKFARSHNAKPSPLLVLFVGKISSPVVNSSINQVYVKYYCTVQNWTLNTEHLNTYCTYVRTQISYCTTSTFFPEAVFSQGVRVAEWPVDVSHKVRVLNSMLGRPTWCAASRTRILRELKIDFGRHLSSSLIADSLSPSEKSTEKFHRRLSNHYCETTKQQYINYVRLQCSGLDWSVLAEKWHLPHILL